MPQPSIDVRERQYVSQWAADILGLAIMVLGAPGDADSDVTISFLRESTNTVVFQRPATHAALGLYETSLTSAETADPGLYTVIWTYDLDAVAQEYRTYIEVGETTPEYDFLVAAMKDIVDTTWMRFSDLFDSPGGGPNLATYFQTHYHRGRLAQLLRIAVGTLNTAAQPFQTYTIDGDGGASFPIAKWGPLLERALYIECLKHLIRSYVEQPMFVGGSVTRLDRRDYKERWESILGQEESVFRSQMDVFKIANMGLGRPAVLVAGGVYARYGPTRVAGSVAARPRYSVRWY